MVRDYPLRLTSFWKFHIVWRLFFSAWGLLGLIPDLERRSGALRENTVEVRLLFLGSCLLHPVCRWLLRRYPSWLAFEFRAFGASLGVGVAGAAGQEIQRRGFHNLT